MCVHGGEQREREVSRILNGSGVKRKGGFLANLKAEGMVAPKQKHHQRQKPGGLQFGKTQGDPGAVLLTLFSINHTVIEPRHRPTT